MANIITFPKAFKALPMAVQGGSSPATNPVPKVKVSPVIAAIVRVVWVVTALLWPILKWVVSLDVAYQFVRMLYHWHTPGIHAGWTCLLHFAALTALTYFVALYKPKGL